MDLGSEGMIESDGMIESENLSESTIVEVNPACHFSVIWKSASLNYKQPFPDQ